MKKIKIAVISIGQTPASSVINDLFSSIEPHFEIHELGLLDGLSFTEVAQLAPQAGERPLIAGIRDKYLTVVSFEKIQIKLDALVKGLAADFDLILLLCSESGFAILNSHEKIIFPSTLLTEAVTKAGLHDAIVVIPYERQKEAALQRWAPYIAQIEIQVRPIQKFGLSGLSGDWPVILDCVGYSLNMEKETGLICSSIVIGARSQIRNELFQRLSK